MEELLGILFCGGRETRLAEITRYISKSFIPIYDLPAFRYGLALLESSKLINEIIILTNEDNDNKFKHLGYRTIIQDDSVVTDMFSGWSFINSKISTNSHGVLVPSDNIIDTNIDYLINRFNESGTTLVFLTYNIDNKEKLSQMGCYNPDTGEFSYKQPNPDTSLGVLAPYIIRSGVPTSDGDQYISNIGNFLAIEHKGYWFDIGDYRSICEASNLMQKIHEQNL